jgi:hypothetical protein
MVTLCAGYGKWDNHMSFEITPFNIIVKSKSLFTPRSYAERLLAIEPANNVALWLLNETSGTAAVDQLGNHGGTHVGPTLANASGPNGVLVPSYDGDNDRTNIYSANLNTNFPKTEGTAIIWLKARDADFWGETQWRTGLNIEVNSDNRVYIWKRNVANQMYFVQAMGGTVDIHLLTTTSLLWNMYSVSWSVTNDDVSFYHNGSLLSSHDGVGTFAGTLDSNKCVIGGDSPTGSWWDGWCGPTFLASTPFTADQHLLAYNLGRRL